MGCFYSLSKWGDTAAYFVQRGSLRNFGPRFVLVDWGDILTFRIMNRSGDSLIMLWSCTVVFLIYLVFFRPSGFLVYLVFFRSSGLWLLYSCLFLASAFVSLYLREANVRSQLRSVRKLQTRRLKKWQPFRSDIFQTDRKICWKTDLKHIEVQEMNLLLLAAWF